LRWPMLATTGFGGGGKQAHRVPNAPMIVPTPITRCRTGANAKTLGAGQTRWRVQKTNLWVVDRCEDKGLPRHSNVAPPGSSSSRPRQDDKNFGAACSWSRTRMAGMPRRKCWVADAGKRVREGNAGPSSRPETEKSCMKLGKGPRRRGQPALMCSLATVSPSPGNRRCVRLQPGAWQKQNRFAHHEFTKDGKFIKTSPHGAGRWQLRFRTLGDRQPGSHLCGRP